MKPSVRCLFAMVPIASLLLSACASTSPAPATEVKLFDRLGGLPAITAVVDKTIDSAARDPRTSRSFKGIKLQGIKEGVVAQLCEATGGPCRYEGTSMPKVHSGLDITGPEFDAFAQQLVATLDEFKVGAREKDDLLKILGPMKKDIVSK
jgi:hemoglobin